MNIIILDDYQDAVRKLHCASKLDGLSAKVFTNTVRAQANWPFPARCRSPGSDPRAHAFQPLAAGKAAKLKLICQTGRVGSHIDIDACTELGIAVAQGVGFRPLPRQS